MEIFLLFMFFIRFNDAKASSFLRHFFGVFEQAAHISVIPRLLFDGEQFDMDKRLPFFSQTPYFYKDPSILGS